MFRKKRKKRIILLKIKCKNTFLKRVSIKLEPVIIETAKLKFTFASSMKNRFVK